MYSIDDMMRRQSTFETDRSNFDSLWETAMDYLLPQQSEFRRKWSSGQVRTDRQFDSFPQIALDRYAAAMDSGLTPRNTQWHRLSSGDEALDKVHEVKLYLESANQTLWDMRYSPKSNFASQNHELLLQNGAIGNGPMFIEPHPSGDGAVYRSCHMSEMYWATNEHGLIDTWHRKRQITARQLRARFPMDRLPKRVHNSLERGALDDTFDVLHVVMPREDYDPDRLDHIGKPWIDAYIACEDKQPLQHPDEGGYHECPYMCFRHTVSNRENYGRGPGTMMLPDIKMINWMKRDIIEAANMAVDPPLLLHADNILGEFRLEPGSRAYGGVDDNGKQMAVPFLNGTAPGLTLEMVQDVRSQIDDVFLGKYFRVLQENPNMTATQAMLLAQQQGQMTSPVVGRGQTEYLDPLLRRESGIASRQGKMPLMPEFLADYFAETAATIEYESPMVRAARTHEGVGIMSTFEALAPWAQVMGPEVYARFDSDETAIVLAEVNGAPARVLKSDEQVEAEKQQKAQQQAMSAALEAAPIAADTVKTLSEVGANVGAVGPQAGLQ